jgi:ubiquinone/menaquinone biosynthesis C-methylase UbiE
MDNKALTKNVESWWNNNPFTYNGKIGVGKTVESDEALTLVYFNKVEARFHKHSGGSLQDSGKPVFSKFVDYESLKGKRVLDIAVGTGFSAVEYAKAGAEVTGIDLTEYSIIQTKKNFELRGLTGTVLKMDAQKMDFPDNYFDFVSAHGCLMHMPDTQGAVAEIFRVLKPGGKIYVWMYHRGWYFWFNIIFLRGILLGQLFKNHFNVLALTSKYTDGLPTGGNMHTKMFTRGGFRRLFDSGGFREIEIVTNYNPNEWVTAWPTLRFPVGKYIPQGVRRFLSEKAGFAFSATITAVKK